MKRYLRTCYYYNGFDTAFAFVSLFAIVIGCYELSIRAEVLLAAPLSFGFLNVISTKWLFAAVGLIIVLNYVILLRTNPRRWILCVFLFPVRLLLVWLVLLIKAAPVIFTGLIAAAAASAAANTKKAQDKRHYTARQRKEAQEEACSDRRAAVAFGGAAAISVWGARRTAGRLASRIRSQNDQYVDIQKKPDSTCTTAESETPITTRRPALPEPPPLPSIDTTTESRPLDAIPAPTAEPVAESSHHAHIADYLPEIVLCCVTVASMVLASKCKTDEWGMLIVMFLIVHLFWRGFKIIRNGFRNKMLIAATIKAFVLLPVIDFAVMVTSIAVVLYLAKH